MNILITGASGYLGSALLRHLMTVHPDWDADATFFSAPPAPGTPHAHALDLRDPDSVEEVIDMAEPNVIFHTAALNAGDADEMYRTNALGSDYLARSAARHGVRLIHLSSDVIFDGERGNYTEEDAPNPLTPYAVSKADAERAILESGADAVLVRTSLIYGFKPLDPRTRSVLLGEMPNLFVDEWRCPVWVNSLCEALVELAEIEYRGILNVAGRQPLNRYDFGVKLMRTLNGDESRLVAMNSRASGLVRPRDCTLNLARAAAMLKTDLIGVDEMLAHYTARRSAAS